MTPSEQLDAIYARCHELYPIQERTFEEVRRLLGERGVRHLRPNELDDEQRAWLAAYVHDNVMPFLSPQIINARHPFPHLENGALYVVVRLNGQALETGLRKFGAMVGDRVEVGCNSVLNPGTILGRDSMVYPTSCVRGVVPDRSIHKNDGRVVPRIMEEN